MLSFLDRCRGCLLGGAVGDALGAPVEFLSIAEIRRQFGPAGIRDLSFAYGRIGAITDDTQMTLFTAEGLLRASVRQATKGICHLPSVVHFAYLRWLKTQEESPAKPKADGLLMGIPSLWSSRAPGNTCLSALRQNQRIGQPAVNDSKGCGGLMRVAPVGLVMNREAAFETGSATAALTHGHPSGFLSAGFLAVVIAELAAGVSLQAAIDTAKQKLVNYPDHGEVLEAVENAQAIAILGASQERIAAIGQGWVAEEALAIALYCALATSILENAVMLAVNHSGDSDSTGSIAGNICGALYGEGAIPARWLEPLELREEIMTIADDLGRLHEGTLDLNSDQTFKRYSGS